METSKDIISDSFDGWAMASVGCHWSRELPDGTSAYLSTWANGFKPGDSRYESGYRLTSHGASMDYPTLDDALEGFVQLTRYYGSLFTGSDALMGPSNDPVDLGESVSYRS